MSLKPKALKDLQVSKHLIPALGLIPNTSLQNKPLLIYRSVFSNDNTTTASSVKAHIDSIGSVVPQWQYTMYSQDHFHSTSHEVLCILSGKAKCCFGGESNEDRVEPLLQKGDVVVIPAGVSHRLLEEVEKPFQMLGCYPPGASWDMCYGRKGEEKAIDSIASLSWLRLDPIYGQKGPVTEV